MGSTAARLALAAALATALALVAFGCGSETETVTLSAADDGSAVSLAPEQELVISLEGNPTTGFSWAVLDVDEAVVAPVGEPEYMATSTDSTLVGGGGTYTLRFKGVAAGETTLNLGYARSWETGVQPEDTFTVTVTVK